ncbi:hypothetical protein GH714_039597 [Hevea brasiliensis]|uniref:Ty3 transposon capsid-like protein domain-containing protein n=1 Tax=Hevea brasiliensis TaxID=3981 RepID=A0A6A6M3I3_HEVBR|nr:hypothetical protein GH714_039597 [Hevea brasiliensis]
MAEGTRSHDWKKEVALMLQEIDQKWEQRHIVWQQEVESRSSQAILKLNSFITGLSLQDNEIATANRVQMETASQATQLNSFAFRWKSYFVAQGYVTMKGVGVYTDWQEYVRELRARFGKQEFDDPLAELKNLKQVQILQEYLDAFYALYPKTGIREDQALSFFLSGLNDELKMPVRMFKPQTLVEAYALAKLQEIIAAAIQNKSRSI